MHKINTNIITIYKQAFIKVKFPKILGTKVELCLLEALGVLEACGALDATGLLDAFGALDATGLLEACETLDLLDY